MAGALLGALLSAGCSNEPSGDAAPSTTSTTSTTTPLVTPPKEWVAVYAVSPYSDARQQEFVRDAGEHVFEGPVRCFEGLAPRADIDADATVLAVVAGTEDAVRAAAAEVEGTPILVADFPSTCRD